MSAISLLDSFLPLNTILSYKLKLSSTHSYRKISINNLELRVPKAPLHERIQLRIVPDKESGLSEVRFWHKGEFLGSQKVKNSKLNLVQF